MRKIIYFYNVKARYYSSYPIINNFKILYNKSEEFKRYKLDPIPFTKFVKSIECNDCQWEIGYDKMLKLLQEGVNELLIYISKNKSAFKKGIILMFHPVGYDCILERWVEFEELRSELGMKFILWQDDLHAYFKDKKRGEILERLNWILTPSPIFLKNVKSMLFDKTKFFFYSMDFSMIDPLNKPWEERQNKILLSGSCNRGYTIRHKLLTIIKRKEEMSVVCDYLKRPKIKEYNRPLGTYFPVGENYYKILSDYKGAFFGFYEYPKNFNLAKIIEILGCGCLGFFENSKLLEEELGLKAFEHYIPILDENGELIKDINYYHKWLKEGKNIMENGRKYAKNNFSNNNGFFNYIKILKKI